MIRSGSEGQGPRVRVQGAGAQRSGLKGLSEAQGVGSKRLGSKRLGSKRLGSKRLGAKRLGANGQVPRGGDQGSWVEGPGHVPLKFSIIYYLTLIIPLTLIVMRNLFYHGRFHQKEGT